MNDDHQIDPAIEAGKLQSFIQHFGEMGSRWGINRTAGQMFALLLINEQAVNPDQIASTLNLSRSNVSMGIKELSSWNLLRTLQKPGDRKTYYTAPRDIWEIARAIILERRKREIDPTLSILQTTLMAESAQGESAYAQARMHEMLEVIELMASWSAEMQTLTTARIKQLLKLGSGINRLLDIGERLAAKSNPTKKTDT